MSGKYKDKNVNETDNKTDDQVDEQIEDTGSSEDIESNGDSGGEILESATSAELLTDQDGDKVSLLVQARETNTSKQQEMPFAFVEGQAVTDLPADLYIPPDALEVFLEAFEGPLDLLLYLIKRQNLDILDINVAEITDQYIGYVDLMETSRFELAAEYLVMAAMLAEIKSRILLPRQVEDEEEEDDPRAQLIRRLQEYERYRAVAEEIDELPRMDRDLHLARAEAPVIEKEVPQPDIDLKEILLAFADVLRRSDHNEKHHIGKDKLTTRERMSEILLRINDSQFTPMTSLMMTDEGRMGVVVTFLAIMELIKESLVELAQSEPFGPIHIKARSS